MASGGVSVCQTHIPLTRSNGRGRQYKSLDNGKSRQAGTGSQQRSGEEGRTDAPISTEQLKRVAHGESAAVRLANAVGPPSAQACLARAEAETRA